jgi:hypothetical protein
MNDASVVSTKPRPQPVDLVLVVAGSIMLSAGYSMLSGSLKPLILGFLAGCTLGAIAWRWPKVAGPGLLVLAIPGLLFGLFLAVYTFGMPHALVSLWGAVTFLIGGVGVLRRRSVTRQPKKHTIVQAGLAGLLAGIFLLYFLILWPPQGKSILLDLPILNQDVAPQVRIEGGGNWAGYWSLPREAFSEVLMRVEGSLESAGWTIVDSGRDPTADIILISAQRGAYSLVVLYDPNNPSPYPGNGIYSDAYMTVKVRRGSEQRLSGLAPIR